MKQEENKKQDELKDEQLDNVAGAGGILDDVINDVREKAKEWMEEVKNCN